MDGRREFPLPPSLPTITSLPSPPRLSPGTADAARLTSMPPLFSPPPPLQLRERARFPPRHSPNIPSPHKAPTLLSLCFAPTSLPQTPPLLPALLHPRSLDCVVQAAEQPSLSPFPAQSSLMGTEPLLHQIGLQPSFGSQITPSRTAFFPRLQEGSPDPGKDKWDLFPALSGERDGDSDDAGPRPC